VAAARGLVLDLGLDAPHQNLVTDAQIGRGRLARRIGDRRKLPVAEVVQRLRLGGVVAVDVDDHVVVACSRNRRSLAATLSSVCPATGTSQYSARGRHSSRYLAADVACDASWPGTINAGISRRNRSSGSAPGAVSLSNRLRAIAATMSLYRSASWRVNDS